MHLSRQNKSAFEAKSATFKQTAVNNECRNTVFDEIKSLIEPKPSRVTNTAQTSEEKSKHGDAMTLAGIFMPPCTSFHTGKRVNIQRQTYEEMLQL